MRTSLLSLCFAVASAQDSDVPLARQLARRCIEHVEAAGIEYVPVSAKEGERSCKMKIPSLGAQFSVTVPLRNGAPDYLSMDGKLLATRNNGRSIAMYMDDGLDGRFDGMMGVDIANGRVVTTPREVMPAPMLATFDPMYAQLLRDIDALYAKK